LLPTTPTTGSRHRRPPPIHTIALSVAALAIPAAAGLLPRGWVEDQVALLVWLPALVPPFLLAYYRGWRGASVALAGGMVTLALVQVELLLLGISHPAWPLVSMVVALLVIVSIGSGWVAELLHRERERLDRSALTDPATGLPNRRHAEIFLDAAWAAAVRGRQLSVVIFEIDRAPTARREPDRDDGGRVLRTVARVLAERTRRMDLSARLEGEMLLAVLPDCPVEQAAAFAEQVRSRVARLYFPDGNVTLSAGVAAIEDGMGSPDVLLATADRAVQVARDGGGNGVARADTSLPRTHGRRTRAAGADGRVPGNLEGVRVVLVDDDDEALTSTARMLGRLGCVVRSARSARDALRVLTRDAPVDVVVTDIVMPEMSGFTLIDIASKARGALPVLYMSGYPREEVYWGGIPGAPSAFLSKPLEIGELRRTLAGLLPSDREADGVGGAVQAAPEQPSVVLGPTEGRLDEEPRPEPTPDKRGHILVIDDDASVVATLQRLFTRAGYQRPVGITEPTKAVDVLRGGAFDLMILDLHMPEMDGFQVLTAVRAHFDPEEYFPVLVLTGEDDPLVRRRALAAGAMDFLNKPFDPAEAEARVGNLLATRFLNQSVALQRDTLEDRVRERTAELADTRSEILHRLACAAEYRDDVTGRHAERVGLLSSRLAAELGLPPREVDIIRRTAPLHDIGKIGVPDAILRKVGRLTPGEFEIMKTHTTIGAQILGGSSHRLLEVAREIALCHHERWDGLGYPYGRRGSDTPLEARIVAVADTFDTIAHNRPYKAALPPRDAVAEIVRCRGTHYDPDTVDAFLAIVERVGVEDVFGLADPLDPLRDTMGPTALSS
jgi:putative two-component system response regulator